MKNLVWAIGLLVIIIMIVFVFASQQVNTDDTAIPSPISVATPSPDVANLDLNNVKEEKVELPFKLISKEEIEAKQITLSTNKGDIVLSLSGDSPIASSNFISLVNKKFYDGLIFHRVIKGFMIQGGDPSGNGSGGPGYQFPDEPVKTPYVRGIVAMANAGPNTNGSQFFIMHQDYQLPPSYTIFGRVVSGIEAVDAIAASQVDENNKPIEGIIIERAYIE